MNGQQVLVDDDKDEDKDEVGEVENGAGRPPMSIVDGGGKGFVLQQDDKEHKDCRHEHEVEVVGHRSMKFVDNEDFCCRQDQTADTKPSSRGPLAQALFIFSNIFTHDTEDEG